MYVVNLQTHKKPRFLKRSLLVLSRSLPICAKAAPQMHAHSENCSKQQHHVLHTMHIRERGSVLYLGMATEILNLP